MRPRRQYRILQAAFVFALIGVAFFGSYAGMRFGGVSDLPTVTAGDQSKSLWAWITHDATGVFTIVLCVVTSVLAFATYGLYRSTAELARDSREASAKALTASTEATNLARQQFLAGYRPRLRVRRTELVPLRQGRAITVTIEVANIGGSDAEILHAGVNVTVQRTSEETSRAILQHLPTALEGEARAEPTKLVAGAYVEFRFITNLIYDESMAIPSRGGFRLRFRGSVRYRDLAGTERRTRFDRRYDLETNRYVPTEDPDFDYED